MIQASINASEVCAVVVTYFPSPDVWENVRLISREIPAVVIDNSTSDSCEAILKRLEALPRVQVIRNRSNRGIAAALNQGICFALSHQFKWVATFDQDSTIPGGFVSKMFEGLGRSDCAESVGLISPRHISGEDTRLQPAATCDFIRTAITSGSLIRLAVINKIGNYDESLFIDYVDFDFCLRLWSAGYKVIRVNDVFLNHRLGSPTTCSVFGRQVTIRSHNAWRRYFISRNRILIYRRYFFRFPAWSCVDIAWWILDLVKIVFFEREKWAKLVSMGRGMLHGLIGANAGGRGSPLKD